MSNIMNILKTHGEVSARDNSKMWVVHGFLLVFNTMEFFVWTRNYIDVQEILIINFYIIVY